MRIQRRQQSTNRFTFGIRQLGEVAGLQHLEFARRGEAMMSVGERFCLARADVRHCDRPGRWYQLP
jgi:hypothetical protein